MIEDIQGRLLSDKKLVCTFCEMKCKALKSCSRVQARHPNTNSGTKPSKLRLIGIEKQRLQTQR